MRLLISVVAAIGIILISFGSALADNGTAGAPVPATSAKPAEKVADLIAQAQAAVAASDNLRARDDLKRALSIEPGNLTARKLLGDVEYRLQNYRRLRRRTKPCWRC